jgi:hypothetical protein
MKRVFFAAVLGLALCVVGSAQDKTVAAAVSNFAGDWEIDLAKSKIPANPGPKITAYKLTVTQHEKTIDVASLITLDADPGTIAQSRTYNLDGTETDTELKMMQMSAPAKLKGKWLDGGKLELSMNASVDAGMGPMSITQNDVWELSDSGKTLKVHRVRTTPRGTEESDMVFAKK